MKAVSCAQGTLSVVELPDPSPGRGQLVLDVRACGICGSDLHAKDHGDELADVLDEVGYHDCIRRDTPTVMGHEFAGVVAERGSGTPKGLPVGTPVVSFPMVRAHGGVQMTGLSPLAPGGYAERVLVEASMTFPVPNGLSLDTAALTEPMAVALHAVRRSEITKRDTAIVIGCGPVGLAVICQLKAAGVRTIIASDLSPARRVLAARCGADIVVDPTENSPYGAAVAAGGKKMVTEFAGLGELAIGSMEKLRKLPGWEYVYRAADALGAAGPKRPVIFECVGVPGLIQQMIAGVPPGSRIAVAGINMGSDSFEPAQCILKELDIRFSLYYSPEQFAKTFAHLAAGDFDVAALLTGTVGLDGVADAFERLRSNPRDAKILLDPTR